MEPAAANAKRRVWEINSKCGSEGSHGMNVYFIRQKTRTTECLCWSFFPKKSNKHKWRERFTMLNKPDVNPLWLFEGKLPLQLCFISEPCIGKNLAIQYVSWHRGYDSAYCRTLQYHKQTDILLHKPVFFLFTPSICAGFFLSHWSGRMKWLKIDYKTAVLNLNHCYKSLRVNN